MLVRPSRIDELKAKRLNPQYDVAVEREPAVKHQLVKELYRELSVKLEKAMNTGTPSEVVDALAEMLEVQSLIAKMWSSLDLNDVRKRMLELKKLDGPYDAFIDLKQYHREY